MKITVTPSTASLETDARPPLGRRDDLLVEDVENETLVYDLRNHRAHCLNPSAAAVWRASDGRTSPPEMARRLGRLGLPDDEAVVWMALSRLEQAGLLEGPVRLPAARRRFSRKEVVRALGLTAGLGLLLPAVTSITAPLAAQAASCIRAVDCSAASPPDCTGLPICENRNSCCVQQGKRCSAKRC